MRRVLPRMRYGMRSRNGKLRAVIVVAAVFILLLWLFNTVTSRLIPIAASLAESEAQEIINLSVNQALAEKILDGQLDYNKFYTIAKDDKGNITGVVANVVQLNILKAQLVEAIQNKMSNITADDIYIPIGSLFNNEIFSNRGFKIPIKLLAVGSINVDFSDSFSDAGINQTKHEIQLDLISSVTMLFPIGSITTNITTSLPLAQTIIVGTVPQSYTTINLGEGLKEVLDEL